MPNSYVAGRYSAADFGTWQAGVQIGPSIPAPAITSFSIASNVVTIVAANSLTVGQQVVIAGLSTGTYLNGQTLTIASASASQFTASFTHADVSSTADTGVAKVIQTVTFNSSFVTLVDGSSIQPFNTNASLTFSSGSASETVTPVSVSGATISAAFQFVHGSSVQVTSGTFGLQEAINFAFAAGGGVVQVSNRFSGSASTITSATAKAGVTIEDCQAGFFEYVVSGSTYIKITSNGQNAVTVASGDGALPIQGLVMVTKGSAAALTLATPTAGTDDGRVLTVQSTTAFAHTITTASNKINGSLHIATFDTKAGCVCILRAYNGVWYSDPDQTSAVLS